MMETEGFSNVYANRKDKVDKLREDPYVIPPLVQIKDVRKAPSVVFKSVDFVAENNSKEKYNQEKIEYAKYVQVDENPINVRELNKKQIFVDTQISNTESNNKKRHFRKNSPGHKLLLEQVKGPRYKFQKVTRPPKSGKRKQNMEVKLLPPKPDPIKPTPTKEIPEDNFSPSPPLPPQQSTTTTTQCPVNSANENNYHQQRRRSFEEEALFNRQLQLQLAKMDLDTHTQKVQLRHLITTALSQSLSMKAEDTEEVLNHKHLVVNSLTTPHACAMISQLFNSFPAPTTPVQAPPGFEGGLIRH